MCAAKVFPKSPDVSVTRVVSQYNNGISESDNKQDAANRDSLFMKAPRVIFKGHQLPVQCVSFLVIPGSDDTLVFSGSDDKLIFVWSLKTGEKLAELSGHTQRVTCMCTFYSPGKDALVMSGGWDERLRIWNIQELLASSKSAKTCVDLSQQISSESKVLKGHANRVFGLTIMKKEGYTPVLASGSSDSTVRVWSIPDGNPL
jgi:WD40 repeat protein